jgi:hypothetical protein
LRASEPIQELESAMNHPAQSGPARGIVNLTCMAAVGLCLSLPSAAIAQTRGIGIGIGVGTGIMVLKGLSNSVKSGSKGKSSKATASSKSKKRYAAKKKSSGGSSKSRKEEETDIAKDGDDAARETTSASPDAAAATAKPSAGPGLPPDTGSAAAIAAGATATDALAITSKSEVAAAQQHLQYMGYDVRDVSGTLDLKTKIAVMQFQDSIGQPSTGVMTVKQLQTLFLKVAEKTAASK